MVVLCAVCSPGAEEEGSLSAKLHIVDLAGSERIFRTGDTLIETDRFYSVFSDSHVREWL
jgi:hypothetical protein